MKRAKTFYNFSKVAMGPLLVGREEQEYTKVEKGRKEKGTINIAPFFFEQTRPEAADSWP